MLRTTGVLFKTFFLKSFFKLVVSSSKVRKVLYQYSVIFSLNYYDIFYGLL